jgi:hypothetical protein
MVRIDRLAKQCSGFALAASIAPLVCAGDPARPALRYGHQLCPGQLGAGGTEFSIADRTILRGRDIQRWAIIAIVLLRYLAMAHSAGAEDAPFGFTWSQTAQSLPEPSATSVDGNIETLTYRGPRLPPRAPHADIIVLRVCDRLGLQEVRSFSGAYPLAQVSEVFLDVYARIIHRYGEADQADLVHGTADWNAQHIRMRLEGDENDDYRVLLISDGPQLRQCLTEHERVKGNE